MNYTISDKTLAAIKWSVSFALSNVEDILAEDDMKPEAQLAFVKSLETAEKLLAKSSKIEVKA